MSASPKAVAVDFLRAREHGDLEKVMELLSEDAIFTDGPRGVHRGASAIRAVLSEIGARAPTVTRTVKSMVADDTTVMMERVDTFAVGGTAIHYEIAVVFEIDGRGESNAGTSTTTSSRSLTISWRLAHLILVADAARVA
jgi:limonene-1,2-epoxide hydrolase